MLEQFTIIREYEYVDYKHFFAVFYKYLTFYNKGDKVLIIAYMVDNLYIYRYIRIGIR